MALPLTLAPQSEADLLKESSRMGIIDPFNATEMDMFCAAPVVDHNRWIPFDPNIVI